MAVTKFVRYIGIDFGTSTSVVCYKDYNPDGTPVTPGDPIMVKFSEYSNLIPTLVLEDTGSLYFGDEAEMKAENEPERLHSEFKMDLVGAEGSRYDQAKQLSRAFLGRLYEQYTNTATAPIDATVEEHTYVSYPVKWPPTIRDLMVETARAAGFPNVVGMTEPEAAMRYFLTTRTGKYKELADRGVIKADHPVLVLLIDMGAGTSDFVLYRYMIRSDGRHEHKTLGTWPESVSDAEERGVHLGGREIDARLFDSVIQPALPGGFFEKKGSAWERTLRSDTRKWKETVLAPELRADKTITRLPSRVAQMITFFDDTLSPATIQMGREQFQALFRGYLDRWINLVETLLQHTTAPDSPAAGQQADLVILTGGHSQWYWVDGLLTGGLPGCGAPALEKVREDPARILRSGHPQETVARGMAMSGMANWFAISAKASSNREQLGEVRGQLEGILYDSQLTALQGFVGSDENLICMCRCQRLVENFRYTALLLTSKQLAWASKPPLKKCRSGQLSWKDVTGVTVQKDGGLIIRAKTQTLRFVGFKNSDSCVSFDGKKHAASAEYLGTLMKLLMRNEPCDEASLQAARDASKARRS
jgi:molecular chaperone DnaK (HSP70)